MMDAFAAKLGSYGLPHEDVEAIMSNLRNWSTITSGAEVIDYEHAADNLYILLDGWACKYQLLRSGMRQIVHVYLPGEICNIDSLAPHKKPYRLSAITECQFATLPIRWIKKALREREAMHELFWSLVLAENSTLTERVVSLGAQTSHQRLAYFLLDLFTRWEKIGQTPLTSLRLAMTQQDIGETLGLSTVHVNRTLQSLRDEKIITTRGRTYTILDHAKLRATAMVGISFERPSLKTMAS